MEFLKMLFNVVVGEREDLQTPPRQATNNVGQGQFQDQMQNQTMNNDTASSERPKTKRYYALTQAIEARLQVFIRDDLGEHLEIAKDDAYFLDRIEVQPQNPEATALLAEFFDEFKEQSRIDYIKNNIANSVKQNIILDRFTGLWERAAETNQETEDACDDLNNKSAKKNTNFVVYLMGNWDVRPVRVVNSGTGVGQGASHSINPQREPILKIQVFDAANPSGKDMEFGMYPIYLGTAAAPAPSGATKINLQGTFVSREHASIHVDGSYLFIQEDKATNGTWVSDSKLIPPNPSATPQGQQQDIRRFLKKGDWVIFSNASKSADVKDFPRILIKDIASTPMPQNNGSPATPVVSTATPVIIEEQEETVLALLTIKDANGSHQIDLDTLPFNIGRSQGQNYVIPEANKGVSGQHLCLNEITEKGIKVSHPAHNKNGGCYANAQKTPLPAEFIWEFGTEIILAEKFLKHAPTVSLILRAIK